MDVQAIHDAVAAKVQPLPGVLQALASPAGSINPPTWMPYDLTMDYSQTFRTAARAGMVANTFTYAMFVSQGFTEMGATALNGYLAPDGPSSVKAALEADKKLGGVVLGLVLLHTRGAYRLYEIGNNNYLGVLFDVQIWA